MTERNRVDPFGDLTAEPYRGTWMGNRGGAFDIHSRRSPWASKAWIYCHSEFKERQRVFRDPRRKYTHRLAEFKTLTVGRRTPIRDFDDVLHEQRRGERDVATVASLPSGTFVDADAPRLPQGSFRRCPSSVAVMRPTALITGASRGLGAAIARELAATHDLILGGRTAESLAPIVGELAGSRPLAVDLTDYDAVAAAVADTDRLDVLVHNAGVADIDTVADSSVEQWRHNLEGNVIAVAELTRLLLPALRSANGHVVLINSGAGLRANPGWGPYAASKFALRAFGDALRLEEPSLRVTSVHPGRIDTDMQRALIADEGRDYDPSEFLTPESVALAVANAVATPSDAHPVEIVLRPVAR